MRCKLGCRINVRLGSKINIHSYIQDFIDVYHDIHRIKSKYKFLYTKKILVISTKIWQIAVT